jgi:O-antigen ligase
MNPSNIQQRISKHIPLIIQSFMGIYIITQFPQHLTAIEEIAFYGSLFIGVYYVYVNRADVSLHTPLTIPFLLFLLWVIFCIPFALNKPNTIHDIYAHLVKYYLFYFMIIIFFRSQRNFTRLVWFYVIVTTLFCLGGIIFFYLIHNLSFQERFFLGGGGFYIPYLEFLFEFALVCCAQLISVHKNAYTKGALGLCFLSIASAIVLSQTRSALLAVTGSLFIMCFFWNRKYMFLLFMVIVFLLVLPSPLKDRILHEQSATHNVRFGTIRLFSEVIKDHPITGIGFGMQTHQQEGFLNRYNAQLPPEKRPSEIVASPHNIFSDVAVRTGIPGLMVFLYILWTIMMVLVRLLKAKSHFVRQWGICIVAAFAGFFIQASFSDATFGKAAIVFYLICAMATILLEIEKKEHES